MTLCRVPASPLHLLAPIEGPPASRHATLTAKTDAGDRGSRIYSPAVDFEEKWGLAEL